MCNARIMNLHLSKYIYSQLTCLPGATESMGAIKAASHLIFSDFAVNSERSP